MAAAITVFAAIGATPVFAEGLNVSADKESCEIGDTVTVTVDAEAIEGAAPPDIEVNFSASRLNFEDCSAEYGGGGGGLVTFKDKKATVTFTTLSGGNAEVSVTATGEDSASPETASVTVSVNGEDTAAATEGVDLTETGVSEGTIDAGDGRFVQAVFADEFKPVLFHKETADFNGQTVECAKFDMGDLTLLYTTDASGGDGKFMIYGLSGDLSEFRMIQGIENRFIIVLPDCEGDIPAGYQKAVLEWAGQTLTAFMEKSVAAGNTDPIDGMDPSDFFLLYGMSSEGNKGWYRYDKNEGTYQRFFVSSLSAEGEGEGEGEETSDADTAESFLDGYIPRNIQSIILLVCAPLALILIIVVIILAVRLHEYAEDLDAFYDDYYGDEEEEEEEEEEERYARRPAKPGAVTAASLVGKSMSRDDEEEDEEDEEEEEDVRYPQGAGEEDEEDDGEEEDEEEEDEEEEDEEDEEDEMDDEEYERYYRSLSRKERKELAKEEKWRAKEEKKAAKRRAQGFEEATPMDWSAFERERNDDGDTEHKPLPPRKKTVRPEDLEEKPRVLHEEDQRERQRRLFEQQQRIEEQRRIEKEQLEAERLREQQQFIASRKEENDLDEDFQFEFLNLD